MIEVFKMMKGLCNILLEQLFEIDNIFRKRGHSIKSVA